MGNPFAPPPKKTLARHLLFRTTALVAVVTFMLSALAAYASFNILENEVDLRLENAQIRMNFTKNWDMNGSEGPCSDSIIRIALTINGAAWQDNNCPERPTIDEVEAMASVPPGVASTVDAKGLGTYRILTQDGNISIDGQLIPARLILAIPYSEVLSPMRTQGIVLGILTLGAIGVAYVGTRQVVEHSFTGLKRLTETAQKISDLPLGDSETEVSLRADLSHDDPDSEVGRVGSAFNHMLDNIDEGLAARRESERKMRQFVADASHELRNPLASIRGYAELSRRDFDELPDTTKQALTRISSESERMSTLVDDLLLLARLDAAPDMAAQTKQPTDLTEIVLDAVSDARAAGPDHKWLLQVPDEPVIVPSVPGQLRQVLTNLLGNARTHTPAGTTVRTSLNVEPGSVVLHVLDDGPGIAPELQPKLFERFTRADEARARVPGNKSTGLGLAIVAAIVQAHHGQVSVTSQPGRTDFSVRLPLRSDGSQ
ncbi:MAG: HAMP domain-containing histidine kinase [Propionibacteriaceae bacterium]|jgi:two-component system OmpR family sensor kinase|nr:HAMP domain-containing histidine kinase [Propionibacteriaceae bacterium]